MNTKKTQVRTKNATDEYFESAKRLVKWWERDFKKHKKETPLQKDLKRLDVLKSERVKIFVKGSVLSYSMAAAELKDDKELFIEDISKSDSVGVFSKKLW